jgi:hypothetical protein
MNSHHDDDDLQLLMLIVHLLNMQLDDLLEGLESVLMVHIREQHRLNRSLPNEKRRPTWDAFSNRISSTHFRRMFRMNLEAFTALCNRITKSVGVDRFRSEEYLSRQQEELDEDDRIIPYIPGEIKVAISLRMLAGGSYLDLVPLFEVSTSHLYNIFHTFLAWVLKSFDL